MDTGEGSFRLFGEKDLETINKMKATNDQLGSIFSVNEELKIKDSRFRIIKITTKKMTLRLLPKKQQDSIP